jgi:trk system potassium uptake protein TrkA
VAPAAYNLSVGRNSAVRTSVNAIPERGGRTDFGVRDSNRRNIAEDRVAVIGLGRFGTSVARTLHELGYEVTAIDRGEKQIQDAADFVTLAAQGDGTDQELLQQLNIQQSAVAVVAQGESLESSVLSTLLLKKLKVPWVVAKAKSSLHGELLRKVGADRVVFPELDAGVRLAHSIGVRHVSDYLSLSANAGIAKLQAPANLIGHSLTDVLGDQTKKLNILMIKRGSQLITVPHYQEVIQAQDELIIVGSDNEIEIFAEQNPGARAGAPLSSPLV